MSNLQQSAANPNWVYKKESSIHLLTLSNGCYIKYRALNRLYWHISFNFLKTWMERPWSSMAACCDISHGFKSSLHVDEWYYSEATIAWEEPQYLLPFASGKPPPTLTHIYLIFLVYPFSLTCSWPRMITPPGLIGCHGARLSPVPSRSPSW